MSPQCLSWFRSEFGERTVKLEVAIEAILNRTHDQQGKVEKWVIGIMATAFQHANTGKQDAVRLFTKLAEEAMAKVMKVGGEFQPDPREGLAILREFVAEGTWESQRATRFMDVTVDPPGKLRTDQEFILTALNFAVVGMGAHGDYNCYVFVANAFCALGYADPIICGCSEAETNQRARLYTKDQVIPKLLALIG
ncbi:MAG: hypothetical protein Q7S37_00045 [bacterium]|nr:hypothetical protein [bacterium]